jgi:hypothetical protein
MAHQLSFGHILRRDWPSFTLFVFMAAFWLIAIVCYLFIVARHPEDKDGRVFAIIAGIGSLLCTVSCGPIIVYRLRNIRRVFASGEMVPGQVLYIGENAEDIAYAVIGYRYQGHEYRVENVAEGTIGRKLAEGDTVDIMVDPMKPSRAYIAKLYLPKS